jgi:hypothetical protein
MSKKKFNRYSKKSRDIALSLKELYARERDKYKVKLEADFDRFGKNLVRGEYKARLYLLGVAITATAVTVGVGMYLSNLVGEQEARQKTLYDSYAEQRHIADYERDVVISTDYADEAEQVARDIAVIQNKYIIAVLEDEDDFGIADIDYEMESTNYLQDISENGSWLNLRDREELKRVLSAGDYYWVGYADNTLQREKPDSMPVFFILYDSGSPIQVIQYDYVLPVMPESGYLSHINRGSVVPKGVLRYRRDWG